jgi:hypothetical protein
MNSLPLLLTGLLTGAALAAGHLESGFANPPMQYRSRPFYWLNAPLEEAELRTQIRAMRDECGFGGFSPLPMSLTRPKYLTEDYFRLYGVMLEEAEKLGLKVDFYDDVDYPSMSAATTSCSTATWTCRRSTRSITTAWAGRVSS